MASLRSSSTPLTPIGRDSELSILRSVLDPTVDAASLVLAGAPGVGKTEIWRYVTQDARARGLRVLEARPSESEAQLAFAGLGDLLDGIDTHSFESLPLPQRRALDTAVRRIEPEGAPLEPHAVALGLLHVLRTLSAEGLVLVAVDDVQWLDPASAGALSFAARRLGGAPVHLLLTLRAGTSSTLALAVETAGGRRVELAPLSFGATRRLLIERLGLDPPRRVLRRLFEVSRGNPLFALQLGRTIEERGVPAVDEEIAVPDSLDALLGRRVSELTAGVRRVLMAVGLDGQLRPGQLAAVTEPSALASAYDAGLIVPEGDRVRPSHPLLSAAARNQAEPSERRELHRLIAGVADDPTLHARHLALATEAPDPDVAAVAEAAARRLRAQGATEEATELAEHALRLTSPGRPEHPDRLLLLANYLIPVDPPRAIALLLESVDTLPTAAARARAQLILAEGASRHTDEIAARLDLAMAEDAADPATRSMVLATRAMFLAVAVVEQLPRAEELALAALTAAAGDDAGERRAIRALACVHLLAGKPIGGLLARYGVATASEALLFHAVDWPVALQRAYRGDVAGAASALLQLRMAADDRGEALSSGTLRIHLAEVALRAGDWPVALGHMTEFRDSADVDLFIMPAYARCRALLAAGRGDPEEVDRLVHEVEAGYAGSGVRFDLLEARRAQGMAALLRGEPAVAAAVLQTVWDHTNREGVHDPGAFPVAPELVEALVETEQPGAARAVANRLDTLASDQEHPWGRITAMRCLALVDLAARPASDEAAGRLRDAAAAYADLGHPFERARTLLALGRAERRRRKWASARAALEEAAAAFDEIGSTGWAELARASVARVASRKPTAIGELTPAEQRAVELAVEGRSNKEIAAALFVAVNTVEVHLSRAYAKLGVRNRTQLVQRLASGG